MCWWLGCDFFKVFCCFFLFVCGFSFLFLFFFPKPLSQWVRQIDVRFHLSLWDLGRVQSRSLILFLWEKQNYILGLTTVQFPNVTMVITYVRSLPLFTTAQFKIQVEYFHDYGRVIISLLKGRRFRR